MDLNLYIISAVILFLYMNIWFIISLILKKGDVADIAWGLGFILLSLIGFFSHQENFHYGKIMILVSVSLWGIRLMYFIGKRNRGQPEDFRYKEWRKNWKNYYLQAYFKIFILQGIFLYMISVPIIWVMSIKNFDVHPLLIFCGFSIWFIGLMIESISDEQKYQFKLDKKNQGQFIQSGLWKYSRHPNYFGEVFLWWGVYLMVISHGFSLLTLMGPATITFLILFISGIPLLEKKYESNSEYEKYKKKTSVFIPLPPKNAIF